MKSNLKSSADSSTRENEKQGLYDYFKKCSAIEDEKVFTALRLYRYSSLLLTSVFYLLGPPRSSIIFKVGVIFFLTLAAILTVHVYSTKKNSLRALAALILVDAVGIAFVIAFTGGLDSPFIWYALNPFIVSSVHLPLYFTWLFVGVFFVSILIEQFYLHGMFSIHRTVVHYYDLILILIVVTLAVQIFARLHLILTEQSQRLRLQQDELFAAYNNLSENHQLLQALSDFQREIVSYKNEKDIYMSLTGVSEKVFPFLKTAVLLLKEPVPPCTLTPEHEAKIIASSYSTKNDFFDPLTLWEVKDKWQDLSPTRQMIAGENKDWIILPVWATRDRLMAVFVGWLNPGSFMYKFPGSLPLFLYFTEQVIQRLQSFKQTEHTLHHLSALYEAAETITSRNDLREVIDLFAAYAKALTGCEKVIFWIEELNTQKIENTQESFYTVKGKRSFFPEEYWYEKLLLAWSEMKDKKPEPMVQFVENINNEVAGQLICVPVKSGSRCFGMLAALQAKKMYNVDEVIQTLTFLADLSAISIERNIAELFADKLLVIEEQNRIANEIHDSVSQNLFSIVYGIDVLTRKAENLPDKIHQQLLTIRDVAAKTAKELRVLIYRLSPRHRGDDTFIKEIKTYLSGLGSLNNISINFNVTGSEEHLNPGMRKAFYRIIKEATGNAVRHGHCSKINLNLDMTELETKLVIDDNGKGFNVDIYNEQEQSTKGLGLVNMRELARSLGGTFEIVSIPGEGVTLTCTVPASLAAKEKTTAN